MPEIWPEITETWYQLRQLSIIFWFISLIATLILSLLFALMIVISPFIVNKEIPMNLFPILWTSFEFMAVSLGTQANILAYVAAGLFILYSFLVNFLDMQVPRD